MSQFTTTKLVISFSPAQSLDEKGDRHLEDSEAVPFLAQTLSRDRR
jgi:hypothetical protein